MADCDICIGFNDDWSYDERAVDCVAGIFRKAGYSVALNSPYSNSITPETPYRYSSLMIEVNKRVYMDEHTLRLSTDKRLPFRWTAAKAFVYCSLLR